jgi:hypothetical protein
MARVVSLTASCLAILCGAGAFAVEGPSPQDVEFFEKKIRPIFVKHCYECHSAEADEPAGSLLLDRKSGWVQGGDLGPAIVPGNPEESLLIGAVRYTESDLEMPPVGKLSDEEIKLLEEWVRRGAPDPFHPRGAGSERALAGASGGPADVAPPGHVRPDRPAAYARGDRGLPGGRFAPTPSPGSSTACSPRPIRRAVGAALAGRGPLRRLQRPGRERRPRQRLAVSRLGRRQRSIAICRTTISSSSSSRATCLPTEDDELRRERLIATGFLSLGPKVLAEPDKEKMEMDIVDEQIDTVGRAFLGLTLGCARCHDHKFDPISTTDYYALAGVFKERPLA